MSNLRLIKQTATASGITSVSMTDVFSSDYDIYKVTVAQTTYDVSNTDVIALKLRFIKSLDLENKLSPETIKLLTEQKGQRASNIYRIKQGMSEKARQTMLKEQQDALEQDMAPFGFIVDGLEDENIGQMVDEYGTKWSPVVRDYGSDW